MKPFQYAKIGWLWFFAVLSSPYFPPDFSWSLSTTQEVTFFTEYWSWNMPPFSQDSTSANPDAGLFAAVLSIVQCNFTERSKSAGRKSCSDECLVVIKLLLVKSSEQRFYYEEQLHRNIEQCKNNYENLPISSEPSECNFTSDSNIFKFRLSNGKELDCISDCVSDIRTLSESIPREKLCFEKLLINKDILENVVKNMMSHNYTEAVSKFNDLDSNYISQLINEVYAPSAIENLAGFFRKLENTSIRMQFLEALSGKMEKEGHLKSNNIITLKKLVDDEEDRYWKCRRDLPCYLSSPDIRHPLKMLQRVTDPRADYVLKTWAPRIRGTATQDIINFGSPQIINEAGHAFEHVIDTLIDYTLDRSSKNLQNASIFAMSLRWNSHKYAALSKLEGWVYKKEGQDKLLIAFRIKEAMETLDGPDPSAPVLSKFQKLKASYPPIIRNVVWHTECLLRNYYTYYNLVFDGHLYSPDAQFDFDSDNKRVLTWAHDGKILEKSTWKFEKVELNEDIRFTIRNIYWEKYLSVYELLGQKYASLRSNAEDYWRVEFSKWEVDEILLYNLATKAYLYASRDTRNVLLLPSIEDGWKLECKE